MNAPRLPNALAENFQTIHNLRPQISNSLAREEIEIRMLLKSTEFHEKEVERESRNHSYSLRPAEAHEPKVKHEIKEICKSSMANECSYISVGAVATNTLTDCKLL